MLFWSIFSQRNILFVCVSLTFNVYSASQLNIKLSCQLSSYSQILHDNGVGGFILDYHDIPLL